MIGTSVFRYYVSEQELTFKIKGYVEANPPKKLTTFVDVISSEDKEKIIRFMQKTENRTERYAEDDFMLGYMNSPSQHTVMIVNESGEPEGWATICHMGDGVDKMSPLFAINDEICMQLLSELLIKYGRGSTMRVLVSVSSLKNFAHEFIKSTPTSHLIAEMHQSFTKYQEYSAGYLEHFYYL